MTERLDIPAELESSLVPELLTDETEIQFRCHKGISCFNNCCKSADITLAPYDILRLKHRLDLDSSSFLKDYTVPFQADGQGMPGVKLKTDDEQVCTFMSESGCSVFEDRPSACRYYGLGILSHRAEGSADDVQYYFRNQESFCEGWDTDQVQSIHDYREEQGLPEYDAINREWMQIMLKKKSAGPSVGTPNPLSFQLYFMACFDLDRFSRFVQSEQFSRVYILSDETRVELEDEIALQRFAFRLLRQVLFDEQTIPTHENILEKRWNERKDIIELRHQAAVAEARQKAEVERKAALDE